MKEASSAQLQFGAVIADTLKIELPKEKTAQAYYLFIQENINKFRTIKYLSSVGDPAAIDDDYPMDNPFDY